MKKALKAVCIQMRSLSFDIENNLKRAENLISKILGDTDLVVLPELFNTGYSINLIKNIPINKLTEFYNITVAFLSKTSKSKNIYITAGVLEIDNNKLYNTLFVFNNYGYIVCRYRKISLFTLTGENDIFACGNELKVFSLNGFKIGLMICYDLRFPEISRAYLDLDTDVLLVSAAFPRSRIDHWRILLKARAVENQSYVIACNCTGENDKLLFGGSSCIIEPDGIVAASLNEKDESFIARELIMDNIIKTRKSLPCLADRKKVRGL